MERCDREILRAYLRDLCCAELLCEKLERGDGRKNYLRCADFLDDLYALTGLGAISAGNWALCAWLRFSFLRSFFAIAAAAFLVSTLAVLIWKLAQGRQNARRRRQQLLREARALRSQLYSAGVLPEESRDRYALFRLYHWAGGTSPADTLLRERWHLAARGGDTGLRSIAQSEADGEMRRKYERMLAGIRMTTDFFSKLEP